MNTPQAERNVNSCLYMSAKTNGMKNMTQEKKV